MLRIILYLALLIAILSPSDAANREFMYRTGQPGAYSTQLGVIAVPVVVSVDGSRHYGIYVQSEPTVELGKKMKLQQGMVILTIAGHSTSTAAATDELIKSCSGSSIQYTQVVMDRGRPVIKRSGSDLSKNQQSTSVVLLQNSQSSTGELESYAFSLINSSRASDGLSQLQSDPSLAKLARDYAEYMAQHAESYDLYSSRSPHIDLQGRSAEERARDAGLSIFKSENIGRATRGFGSSDRSYIGEIHRQMMAEPAGVPNHRWNIMDAEAKRVGIGIARSGNRIFMAQEFGN